GRSSKESPKAASCRRAPKHGSALGELERLASALAAVLLAFLHAAVARQVAGRTQLVAHVDDVLVGHLALGNGGVQAEHRLERAGDALADRAGLAGDAAALHL